MTSTFYARLRVPNQPIELKLAPAADGVRLQFGDRYLYLNERIARQLADAIHDAIDVTP